MDSQFAREQASFARSLGNTTQGDLPALPDRPTLRDCLVYAAMQSPDLQAAFGRWKAAVEQIPQARTPPDPNFSYRWYAVRQVMGDGALQGIFELSQNIPWYEKLELRGDIAAQDAAAEHKRFEQARLRLVYAVKDAYFELAYQSLRAQVLDENVQLLRYIESAARSRYQSAAGPQIDLVRAEVDTEKLLNELAGARDAITTAAARLNAAMNRPTGLAVAAPDGVLPTSMPDLSDDRLIVWMDRSSPDLAIKDIERRSKALARKLAGKAYIPDFTLGVEVDQMVRQRPDAGLPSWLASPSAPSPEWPINILFGLNLPIWWHSYAAGIRGAIALEWSAGRERIARFNELAAQLREVSYRYRDAGRRDALYGSRLLPKAEAALRSTTAAYRSGKGEFSQMVDSHRLRLEFQLEHARARADRAQRLAELESLVGRGDLTRTDPSPTPSADGATTRPAGRAEE